MATQSCMTLVGTIDQPVVWEINNLEDFDAHIKANRDVEYLKILMTNLTSLPESVKALPNLHKLTIVTKEVMPFIVQFFSSNIWEALPSVPRVDVFGPYPPDPSKTGNGILVNPFLVTRGGAFDKLLFHQST